MSTYYDMSISHSLFNDIEWALMLAIKNADETYEIIDFVHVLDAWYELKEEASSENSKGMKRWLEQQKLFEERKTDDIFLFHKIKSVLNEHELDLDVETEFHLVCDLSEVLKENG